MPNWCYNTIEFNNAADCETVARIMTNSDGVLDFNMLIPTPSGLCGKERDWRIENWGTSRNVCEDDICGPYLSFETAWDAPLGIYKELVRRFPDMSFSVSFCEEGNGFAGGVFACGDGTANLVSRSFECDEEDLEAREEAWDAFVGECENDAKNGKDCEAL